MQWGDVCMGMCTRMMICMDVCMCTCVCVSLSCVGRCLLYHLVFLHFCLLLGDCGGYYPMGPLLWASFNLLCRDMVSLDPYFSSECLFLWSCMWTYFMLGCIFSRSVFICPCLGLLLQWEGQHRPQCVAGALLRST